MKLAWQRFYFNGEAPHAAGQAIAAAADHRTRLALHPFAEPSGSASAVVGERARAE